MRVVVVILVYNRYANIERWIRCWKQCNTAGAELVVIHNDDGKQNYQMYQQLCAENQVHYIRRANIGYDMGAFQDICLNRLKGWNNKWDIIIWAADDHYPMSKDFVSIFLSKLNEPGVGVSCIEVSDEVRKHMRTSGFCIRKETASRIIFPANPITTKQECYLLEHRGGPLTFLSQIKRLGLRVEQVAPLEQSPLWDTGHRASLRRLNEHYFFFPGTDRITFIATIYNGFPLVAYSLLAQTHPDWELVLIHDGPNETGVAKLVEQIGDPRIRYIETNQRMGNWGHYHRNWALQEMKEGRLSPQAKYIVITNADNYYTPVFCEYMLKGFISNANAIAVYCTSMVHSYKAWDILECRLKRGYLDSGVVMVKKENACAVGWRDIESHSSDWTYFEDLAIKYSAQNFVKVPGCLFIHN